MKHHAPPTVRVATWLLTRYIAQAEACAKRGCKVCRADVARLGSELAAALAREETRRGENNS